MKYRVTSGWVMVTGAPRAIWLLKRGSPIWAIGYLDYQLLIWTFPNSLLDNAIRLYYIWHMRPTFEWDDVKYEQNKEKHGVSFFDAQYAFADPHRVIIEDLGHSANEDRFFCFGKVKGGIMTVRFTERQGRIRIIGAGYWRKGRKIYDQENQIHR